MSIPYSDVPMDKWESLTDREREVFRRRVNGETPEQIATALNVTRDRVMYLIYLYNRKLRA